MHALLDHPSHDAFRRGALGATAGVIWSVLRRFDHGATVSQLKGALPALSQDTIRRNLRDKLGPSGLASQDSGTPAVWHAQERALDEIATEYGTAGRGATQRRAHEIERGLYHDYRRHWSERLNGVDPETGEIFDETESKVVEPLAAHVPPAAMAA
jgi:hypothetical protein